MYEEIFATSQAQAFTPPMTVTPSCASFKSWTQSLDWSLYCGNYDH
jgi:hypothetical protein